MGYLKALGISASGMNAQRTRVDMAASNLANAETTRTEEGGPWRRVDPLLQAVPLDGATKTADSGVAGVSVSGIIRGDSDGRPVYNPDHPDADENGFVMLPDVNPIHELVNLITSTRSYEANATAFETLKGMARKAIELFR